MNDGATAVAAQAYRAGHDDAHGQHRRDGRVDCIAAALQDFEPGRRSEWMARRNRCRISDDLTGHFDREARTI
jgi:hypothetical protein